MKERLKLCLDLVIAILFIAMILLSPLGMGVLVCAAAIKWPLHEDPFLRWIRTRFFGFSGSSGLEPVHMSVVAGFFGALLLLAGLGMYFRFTL